LRLLSVGALASRQRPAQEGLGVGAGAMGDDGVVMFLFVDRARANAEARKRRMALEQERASDLCLLEQQEVPDAVVVVAVAIGDAVGCEEPVQMERDLARALRMVEIAAGDLVNIGGDRIPLRGVEPLWGRPD
jgi:hypothetical protein